MSWEAQLITNSQDQNIKTSSHPPQFQVAQFFNENVSLSLPSVSSKDLRITAHNKLWYKLDKPWKVWPGFGFCRNGTSLLGAISDDVCRRRVCVYSAALQMNVNLQKLKLYNPTKNNVQFVRWDLDPAQCVPPAGGQRPLALNVSSGLPERPEVTFLYTLHNNPALATTAILEVFRTANEAASAEIVVIEDGSNVDMRGVFHLLDCLEKFFGVRVIRRQNKNAAGFLYSNNAGE
jgi:hypothetical protein